MTDPRPAKRAAFEPARRLLRPTGYNPEMKRPLSTVAGAVLVLLRVVVGVLVLGEIVLTWDPAATAASIERDITSDVALWVIVGVIGAVLVADLVFAVFILRGHNWPRVIVMVISVISISTAFAGWWADDLEITLKTSLLSTAIDVLVLLALSSRSASAYARRNERH